MKRRILNEMLDMPSDEPKKDANSRTVSCWQPLPDGEYCPAHATIDSVPSGLYEPHYNRDVNQVTLKKLPFTTDELYKLPSVEIQEILSDIQKFWDSKELYENYKFVHKRGILLYGEPGCGKSGIIQLCIRQIIELNGLVINVKDEDSVDYFIDFMPHFRNIEPNRPIVVILEDLESIAGEGKYATSQLLNILDGVKQIENVVYVATTNYPEKLEERISNRPSRFDRRYQVEMPNAEIREAYLRAKLGDKVNDIDLVRWIKRTEDMSLSHLKELVISVFLLDKTFDDALALLEGMKVKPRVKKSGEKSIGFGSK
jgi:SpoVK/Ycf46/Vps4 family AAA+-type ATPase